MRCTICFGTSQCYSWEWLKWLKQNEGFSLGWGHGADDGKGRNGGLGIRNLILRNKALLANGSVRVGLPKDGSQVWAERFNHTG